MPTAALRLDDIRPRVTYTVGSTETTTFSVPFQFFSSGDLEVYVDNVLQALGTAYTVGGAGNSGGGVVVFASSLSECRVTIRRSIPLERLTDYPAGSGFKVPALNNAEAKMIAMLQEQRDQAIRISDSDDAVSVELPAQADRAGRALAFDDDGGMTVTGSTAAEIDAVVQAGVTEGAVVARFGPFTADGTTTTFDTGYTLGSTNRVILAVGGILQTAFTVSGSNVVFGAAPPDGASVYGHITAVTADGEAPQNLSDDAPLALAASASAGTADSASRADHVHPRPSAADIGAAAASHTHAISGVTGLQSALDAKAPLASPGLTGTPTAPTASAGTNNTQIATTAFVRGEVAALVDSAPGTLDTLNELAAALGDDPNFATTMTNALALKAPSESPTFTGTVGFPAGFRARAVTDADMDADPMLVFDYAGSGLYFALVNEGGGGQRLYLWDPSKELRNNPHTGEKPALAVFGDVKIGDIIAIELNPMTYFMRDQGGLTVDAVTQLFSAKYGSADTDGGAQFVMAPCTGGTDSDGYASLVAYGRGSGNRANCIRLFHRTGVDAAAEFAYWDGSGHFTPSSAGALDVGTSAYWLRTVHAKAARLQAADGANFVHRETVTLSAVTSYTTIKTLTPSGTAGSYTRGLIKATVAGSTGGVGNGVTVSQWYFDISSAAPTVGVIGTDVTSGTGAALFRLDVSGSDIRLQVQSSDGVGGFGGLAEIEIFAPRPEGNARTWTVS